MWKDTQQWKPYYEILKLSIMELDNDYFSKYFVHIVDALLTIGYRSGVGVGVALNGNNQHDSFRRLVNQIHIDCLETAGYFD